MGAVRGVELCADAAEHGHAGWVQVLGLFNGAIDMSDWGCLFLAIGLAFAGSFVGSGIEDGLTEIGEGLKQISEALDRIAMVDDE